MKTELVNESYFCLKPTFSVREYLLVFPQIILKRKKVTPFSLLLLSLFHFLLVLLYECVHVCMSIEKSKSEQSFAKSIVLMWSMKPSELNRQRKSCIQICPLSTSKGLSMQFLTDLFKSLVGILSKYLCGNLTFFHSIKLLIMLPHILISWYKMGTSATRMLCQRWSNNLSHW